MFTTNLKGEFDMPWEIKLITNNIKYSCDDETYTTTKITFVDRKLWQEPSGGYKEPNDDVMQDTYQANSEHGLFEWVVTARRTGFNSYAEIEDVDKIKEPKNCETLEQPSFGINEVEDN